MQFRPSITLTLTLVTLSAVFLRLGLWQLDRKAEKEMLFESFENAPSMGIREALAAGLPFTRVVARGRYDPDRHILLDNKVWQGRAGVHVLTPFLSENGPTLLVNRGWLPLPANRASLPEIPTPAGERELNGRLANPPEVGQRLGAPDVLASDVWPQLVTYLDLPVVTAALGQPLEPWIILLDASDPSGFEDRRWTAAVMRPEVHGGYAVQWLGLLLAAVVIWIVLGLRRGDLLHRKHGTAGDEGRGGRNEI